jgi:AraC family transcriptional regulator, transcriptional activator of pobA
MKKDNALHRFESLTDFHRVFGLPMPLHPMVSLVEITTLQQLPPGFPKSMAMNFYKIAYKTGLCGQAKYGQSHYDFGEGGLVFTAPNQVFESPSGDLPAMGRLLLIHSDFFLSYPLARKIKDYGYFSYAANEALHLSEQEKETVMAIFKIMEEELHGRIDGCSQDVMVAQIDLLLNYCNRYYNRQFITRKAASKDLLQKLEAILEGYFNDETAMRQGLPTVQWLAERLHVSAHYLSDMLRSLTGQNAQQHIHQKLIEVAKEKLSTSDLSVSEIAYSLGFEFPQSFSRLFKTKTQLSPLEFRQSFH